MATHRLSRTRTYRIYVDMKRRCYDESHNTYVNYGAKGISVCERWLESFENFLEDMGHPPSAKHSIDRIKNLGNYEPGNCRWATRIEQQNNRTNVVFLTAYGKTMSMAQWSRELKIPTSTIFNRIRRGEKNHEKILDTKRILPSEVAHKMVQTHIKNGRIRLLNFNGNSKTIPEWSRELGIPTYRIHQRLVAGWSIEKTLTTPIKG